MIASIAGLFEPTRELKGYRRSHFALLCLILALGTVLRFWGLGNVGLHGDEETMAMSAMAILKHGAPHLPSGMLYVRAPLELYAMAGSAWLLGESEWAFRLPSAVVGSLAGLAAFFMGRRFLPPAFNLAFVATITFMPLMIELSQTARMYGFWLVCVMLFVACIFRWERDQRTSSLLLAMLVWVLALQFQTLSVFLTPLFFWPGLSRRSWRHLIQGGAAFLTSFAMFYEYNLYIGQNYPQQVERPPRIGSVVRVPGIHELLSGHSLPILLGLLGLSIVVTLLLYGSVRRFGWSAVVPVALTGGGLIAMALLQFHVGGILLLIGVVLWLRTTVLPRSRLIAPILVAVAITISYAAILHLTGQFPGRKLIGGLLGEPSIWPIVRMLQSTPVAAAVFATACVVALRAFIKGELLPDHLLYFCMAVWFPLLVMGLIGWNVESRYTMGQLPSFLVCAFAGLGFLVSRLDPGSDQMRTRPAVLAALVLVFLALVGPRSFLQTVNPQYGPYPDHKGAAEYIRSLNLGPNSVLIAEDVLQQTYYLGKVDYWLRQIDDAQHFCIVKNGRPIDQYTATPVIGTGADLTAVLDNASGKEVFIIGTGEDFIDGVASYRGRGIQQVLDSARLKVVYTGRDGKTKIWKLVR